MALPDAVAKQGEAADKLQEEIAKGMVVEAVAKPEEPSPEPEKKEKEKKPEQAPAPSPEPVDWENRYKALKGNYDRDISDLRGRLDKANTTIENLNSLIVQMGQEKPKPEKEPETEKPGGQVPSDAAMKGLNPSDFEGYGDEMIAMVKVVNEQAGLIQKLKEQIGNTENRITETDQDRFFSNLAKAIPDWEKVNTDTRWLAWLAEADPMSGVQRQVLLDNARDQFDAQRAARIFNAFKQDVGWKPEETPQPQPESSPLEEQVAMETGPETPAPQERKGITREIYQKAVNDKIQGRITDEEFEKISNDFQRAIKAGKIK